MCSLTISKEDKGIIDFGDYAGIRLCYQELRPCKHKIVQLKKA